MVFENANNISGRINKTMVVVASREVYFSRKEINFFISIFFFSFLKFKGELQ